MTPAGPATYAWLHREFTDDEESTWLCACFVRGLSPAEALRRIGVIPGPITGDHGFGVSAARGAGGTVLVEYGWGHVCYAGAGALSQGTEAAAVFLTDEGSGFAYYDAGRLITAFDPVDCRARSGEEPDRLLADMRELEMETSFEDPGWTGVPAAAVLALAERATGVRLTRAAYDRAPLCGPTEHLAPYV